MNKNEDMLIASTGELLQLADKIETIFDEVKLDKKERDFFGEVKPFAEHAGTLAEKWEIQALDSIRVNKPRYLHNQQIEQVRELINLCSVQAFFPSTSLKRFKNQLQSIRYTLEVLLAHLRQTI
ncbi:YppE family protein [Peribacillus sp. SCS-37]|uniref:YppE family protein n=1 Tax=Paraperibacillus esterisolvens TaxID=3115296 RepID=UPI0039069D57